MKSIVFLTVLLLITSGQVYAQEGSVGGIVPPPSEAEKIQVQVPSQAPGPQVAPPCPSVTPPKPAKKLPRHKTRDGLEEAAKRVLRGDFAPRRHSHALKEHTHPPIPSSKPTPTPTTAMVKEETKKPSVSRTPPDDEQPAKKPPATPEERKTPMNPWTTVAIVGIIFLSLIAIMAIIYNQLLKVGLAQEETKQAREKSKQDQTGTLGKLIENQREFKPGNGRKVSISGSVDANGGGHISADSDERAVIVPPNHWVITPGPVAPAPPANQGQAFDPNAAAQAGANA